MTIKIISIFLSFTLADDVVKKLNPGEQACGGVEDVGECATEYGKGLCFEIGKQFYFFDLMATDVRTIEKVKNDFNNAQSKAKAVSVCVTAGNKGVLKKAVFSNHKSSDI